MEDQLQSLGSVARLFPLILSGEKTATVRFNECRIQPGPMRYVHDDMPERSVVVQVVRCSDMPLSAVAAFLGKTAEWPDDVMLAGMREHYPEIELTDTVQVIEHEPYDPNRCYGAG